MVRVYSRKKTCWFLRNLVQLDGSVFPMAFVVAFPAAAFAAALVKLHDTEYFHDFFEQPNVEERILNNSAIWSGFTFLVGFLVVFRTSHAYNRFWEACAAVHKMGAEWFDACSALIAYTKVSHADQAAVLGFQNKVIRLFSLLHAVALAELEDLDNGAEELEVQSFEMELVDAGAFADEALMAIRDSTCRVELVYQWIQSLIVDAYSKGVLDVPPPILTRSFQELSGGMVNFHDAIKVADTAFPFPYSQTCDILLFFLYIAAPFVASSYCYQWWLAFFFTFVLIFTYACLTLTGLELEFPYGKDPNDIQGQDMQLEMNHKLRLLVSKVGWQHPHLRKDMDVTHLQAEMASLRNINDVNAFSTRSLSVLWAALPHPEPPAVPKPITSGLKAIGAAGSSSQTSSDIKTGKSSHMLVGRIGQLAPTGTGFFVAGSSEGLTAARRGARVRAIRMRNSAFTCDYVSAAAAEKVQRSQEWQQDDAPREPGSERSHNTADHERLSGRRSTGNMSHQGIILNSSNFNSGHSAVKASGQGPAQPVVGPATFSRHSSGSAKAGGEINGAAAAFVRAKSPVTGMTL